MVLSKCMEYFVTNLLTGKKTKRTFYFDADTYEQIKKLCKNKKVSVSMFVRTVLVDVLLSEKMEQLKNGRTN